MYVVAASASLRQPLERAPATSLLAPVGATAMNHDPREPFDPDDSRTFATHTQQGAARAYLRDENWSARMPADSRTSACVDVPHQVPLESNPAADSPPPRVGSTKNRETVVG